MTTHILVVDDEPDLESLVMQKFRRQIRDGSVAFSFAGDGLEALAMIGSESRFDLVVTDINMPRMDGLTLLERLRATHESLATIIVSAYGDMANIRTAMNRGAFDFLTKPIDFTDLEMTIDKTLRHLGVLRDARQRQAEAEQAFSSLSRYFSPNVAARLSADGGRSVAVSRRNVAMLFSDVAGFTTLAETLEPQTLAALLNDYLEGMTTIVFKHEGTLTKIVGDALHVLFNAPDDQADYAARSVACALDLDSFSEAFRDRWSKNDVVVGVTRIGVHEGPAVVGNFGGERFFDYTAYGDTINVAARLEMANKRLGTRICVSRDIAARVPDFCGRVVGDLMLRGRANAIRAYEPQRPGSEADESGYGNAFGLLEANDPRCLGAFAEEFGKRPGDALSGFHLKRLLNGQTGIVVTLD